MLNKKNLLLAGLLLLGPCSAKRVEASFGSVIYQMIFGKPKTVQELQQEKVELDKEKATLLSERKAIYSQTQLQYIPMFKSRFSTIIENDLIEQRDKIDGRLLDIENRSNKIDSLIAELTKLNAPKP